MNARQLTVLGGVAAVCVVATAVYLVLEIYAGFRPEKAQAFLAGVRGWIDTHTDQVIIVVSLVLGFWLITLGRRKTGE